MAIDLQAMRCHATAGYLKEIQAAWNFSWLKALPSYSLRCAVLKMCCIAYILRFLRLETRSLDRFGKAFLIKSWIFR